MVQLSPFVRVDMNKIKASFENNESYKKAQKELQQLHTQYDTSFYSNYSPGNMTLYDLMNKKTSQLNHIKKSYGIDYINQFFKTPTEIEDIIKKEEQTAKDFLTQLQYFHNSNTNLDNSLLAIFTLFYGLYVFKTHFPSFELKSKIIVDKPISIDPFFIAQDCLQIGRASCRERV